MSLIIFKCEICLKIFKDEFDLNTHILFIEGLFRPFCSTDKTDYSFKFNNTKEYRKEYNKEYSEIPEVKVKHNACCKEYRSRPENIAKRKEYRSRPENIAKAKEYHKEYYTRPEVKAKVKAYNQTSKRKEYFKEYYLSHK